MQLFNLGMENLIIKIRLKSPWETCKMEDDEDPQLFVPSCLSLLEKILCGGIDSSHDKGWAQTGEMEVHPCLWFKGSLKPQVMNWFKPASSDPIRVHGVCSLKMDFHSTCCSKSRQCETQHCNGQRCRATFYLESLSALQHAFCSGDVLMVVFAEIYGTVLCQSAWLAGDKVSLGQGGPKSKDIVSWVLQELI